MVISVLHAIWGRRLGERDDPRAIVKLAGAAYLLPAYLFDVEGGRTEVRSVIAVQDRYLAPPPRAPLPVRPDRAVRAVDATRPIVTGHAAPRAQARPHPALPGQGG